jgi:hypothetical protein
MTTDPIDMIERQLFAIAAMVQCCTKAGTHERACAVACSDGIESNIREGLKRIRAERTELEKRTKP